jgi:Fe2+ transport system protein B
MTGIVSCGAYIPYYRLKKETMAQAFGKGAGKGEKAVAYCDEDSITMAVAAAMDAFSPLSAFSYLVFILLYVPCVAAVSTLAKEMNSKKWTAFSIAWQIGIAYVASLVVYQLGSLFL